MNFSFSKIYIVAPAGYASGGPELSHQLGRRLNDIGFSAFMFYLGADKFSGACPIHSAYEKYAVPYVLNLDDAPGNLIIFPEVNASLASLFPLSKKILWWLSVDNFYKVKSGYAGKYNRYIIKWGLDGSYFRFTNARLLNTFDLHLAQSHYALKFLENLPIRQLTY